MRRGREFYGKHYEDAMKLHKQGTSVKDIASKLNISYSAVYHWVKGLRKPDAGNLNDFESFLKENGPTAVFDLKGKFPKHNEFFLTALRRNMPLKRCVMPRKYGSYAVWYFVEGQEDLLKERVKEMLIKYREAKEKMVEVLGGLMK